MPEIKKEEKKTCQYTDGDYKCDRTLYDKKHCISHSEDREGKKDTFMDRFWQKYKAQEMNERFIFIGFVFPPKADLRDADLQGANLEAVDLRGTDLSDASFEKARVGGVKYDRSTTFRGIDVTQALGSPAFVRFAKDQEYLEEFQIRKPKTYKIWNIFADCGRSFLRWAFWAFITSVIFAICYEIIFVFARTAFDAKFISPDLPGISFLYYSIVTFTTLGFGDIVPMSLWVQILVTIEVILGYIMLGGLISILANKLARRS